MATPSDFATLAMIQSMLGGSSAKEEPFMWNELARRLILNGMTVTAGGVISLGPFSFTPAAPWTIANGGTNSGAALTNGKVMVSVAGAIVELASVNSGVLVTDGTGIPSISVTLPAVSGVNLTALNATNLGSGTLPDGRFPATLPAASGVNLTALNASNLGSGTVPTARQTSITALVDGATPALDASLGNTFRLPAAGDRTIAVPTNPTAGQKIVIIHFASGGIRTLSLNTGAGGFRFGTDITALTATASGKSDYIGCIYNSTDSRWEVVAVTKGF